MTSNYLPISRVRGNVAFGVAVCIIFMVHTYCSLQYFYIIKLSCVQEPFLISYYIFSVVFQMLNWGEYRYSSALCIDKKRSKVDVLAVT